MTQLVTTKFHRHIYDIFTEECRICQKGRAFLYENEGIALIEKLRNIVEAGSLLLEEMQ